VFDHVTIRVPDLEEARRFYETALPPLGYREPATDGHFFEWGDLSIAATRARRAALPPSLLRGIRSRSGRQQHRSRLP
jgi:catechol 2,3-dioxygenase-like lactoylglutathione lyase family enzyme